MIEQKNKKMIACPITRTMNLLGGKWTLPILYVLMGGTKRFKELERTIDGINTRMLVKELKLLEKNGLITRKVYAEIPPRVEYSLTEKGATLQPVIDMIKTWGQQWPAG